MSNDDFDRHMTLHKSPMRLTYAKVLEGSHFLSLAWDNGERGVIKMEEWVKATKGVHSLLNPDFFAKVPLLTMVGHLGGLGISALVGTNSTSLLQTNWL